MTIAATRFATHLRSWLGVSCQREYLADANAAQLHGRAAPLAGALDGGRALALAA